MLFRSHQGDQESQQLTTLYESGGQVDLAEAETYKPGEPLVRLLPGTELSKVRGIPAAALHKHYMDNFKKPVSEQKAGFMAKVKPEVFHHDLLDDPGVDWRSDGTLVSRHECRAEA